MAEPVGLFGTTPPDKITRAEWTQAQIDQIGATVQGGSVAALVGGVNKALNAPGGHVFQHFVSSVFTGVKAIPSASGSAVLKPGLLTGVGAAFPAPIGYIPPEAYDLPPDVYARLFGVPRSEFLGTTGSEERMKVYEAREYASRLNAEFRFELGLQPVAPYKSPLGKEARRVLNAVDADFILSLPEGFSPIQELLPQLVAKFPDAFHVDDERLSPELSQTLQRTLIARAQRGRVEAAGAAAVAVTAQIVGVAALANASGNTFAPESVKPIALAAMAAKKATDLIGKVLMHEKADP